MVILAPPAEVCNSVMIVLNGVVVCEESENRSVI